MIHYLSSFLASVAFLQLARGQPDAMDHVITQPDCCQTLLDDRQDRPTQCKHTKHLFLL